MLFFASLVVVVAIIIGYVLWPKSRHEYKKSVTRVEVSLERLAPLWVKYNKSDTSEEKSAVSSTNDSFEEQQINPIDKETQNFISAHINPYLSLIQAQNANCVIEKLLELIGKYGDSPSVVSGNDKESVMLISVRENLMKISLKQHTYNVTSRLLDLVKKEYIKPESWIPQALVVGLAHDIGKIPEYITGQYNTTEHPLISELKLIEIINSCNQKPLWVDNVRNAVRQHHLQQVQDQLTVLLQSADQESRMYELLHTLDGYTIKDFQEWFDPKEFAKALLSTVNITQTNKWGALTHRGIVYVRIPHLYNVANELRHQAKALDKDFVYTSETTPALHKIINYLRSLDVVAPILGENYVARKCKVVAQSSKVTGKPITIMLVPLKLDKLVALAGDVTISEIESRKSGILEITDVIPT